MKKTASFLFCLMILIITAFNIDAQKAVNNWVFGNRARMDFNGPQVLVTLFDGDANIILTGIPRQ